MSHHPEQDQMYTIVVASHNEKTIHAYGEALGLKREREIVGFNPEDEEMKEPEADDPIEPVLFKLLRVEGIIKGLGIQYAYLVASDVVWSMNGQVTHRPPEVRDSLSEHTHFSDALVAYLVTKYGQESFQSDWQTSFGVTLPHGVETQRRMVTEPVTIIGEYPRLTRKVVKTHLEPYASPGIDLIALAKEKGIPLAVQTAGSDKTRDISHRLAYQLVVRRSVPNERMLQKIIRQSVQIDPTTQFVRNINVTTEFQQVPMKDIIGWFLRAA